MIAEILVLTFLIFVAVMAFLCFFMWVLSVMLYHTDAYYAAEYGKPIFWPFRIKR